MKIWEKFGFPATLPDVDDIVILNWVNLSDQEPCFMVTRVRSINFSTSSDLITYSLDADKEEAGFDWCHYDGKEGLFFTQITEFGVTCTVEVKVSFYE